MSYVKNRIKQEIKDNPELETFYHEEKDELEATVALGELRAEMCKL